MFGRKTIKRLQSELATAKAEVDYYQQSNAKLIKENFELRIKLAELNPEVKESMCVKAKCSCGIIKDTRS